MSKLKDIPGFSRYRITKTGHAIIIDSGEVVKWHVCAGYIMSKLVNDDGHRQSVGKHRILALAFIPNPLNLELINHLDGDKQNNDLDNIEWSSYSDNLMHAHMTGLRTDNIPVKVTHVPTGDVMEFHSKLAACRELGFPSSLYYRVGVKNNQLVDNDYLIQWFPERSTWSNRQKYPGILARNIASGTIIIANTAGELGSLIGLCPKVIERLIVARKFQYPTMGYDFRVLQSDIEWPVYSQEEVEAFSKVKFIFNPIRVHAPNGTVKLFGSVLLASLYTGTHQRSIREAIKCNIPCPRNFKYTKHQRKCVINA